MQPNSNLVVMTVWQDDVELLLTCIIDPYLRSRIRAASETPHAYDDGERLLAFTARKGVNAAVSAGSSRDSLF